MNTKSILLVLGLAFGWMNSTIAQMTSFSYQGNLAVNGAPANGLYDLAFTLFDSPTNGNIVAGPVVSPAVAVSNGLFTAMIDFGATPFSGANRWIEIAARSNGSVVSMTTMLPRQPITAAPYAIKAAGLAGPISLAS